ncbi:hypothetical protein LTR09_005774 [Extremus antarcticus]|uniref:Uncharacterized protein n=1 Tax=Extremus antarcticus TaxID=702011 RepID=A0AAJ0G998_9PEZI|nr:hypothetical protein LTR09_005774 [Extremus antarcticus]
MADTNNSASADPGRDERSAAPSPPPQATRQQQAQNAIASWVDTTAAAANNPAQAAAVVPAGLTAADIRLTQIVSHLIDHRHPDTPLPAVADADLQDPSKLGINHCLWRTSHWITDNCKDLTSAWKQQFHQQWLPINLWTAMPPLNTTPESALRILLCYCLEDARSVLQAVFAEQQNIVPRWAGEIRSQPGFPGPQD